MRPNRNRPAFVDAAESGGRREFDQGTGRQAPQHALSRCHGSGSVRGLQCQEDGLRPVCSCHVDVVLRRRAGTPGGDSVGRRIVRPDRGCRAYPATAGFRQARRRKSGGFRGQFRFFVTGRYLLAWRHVQHRLDLNELEQSPQPSHMQLQSIIEQPQRRWKKYHQPPLPFMGEAFGLGVVLAPPVI